MEYPKLVALGGQVTDADIAEMNRLAQDARAAEKVHRAFIQAKAPSRDVPAVWQLIRDAEAVAIEAAGQA